MAMIPANTNLPKKFPQADERHQEFFEDDFGRGYQASVDKKGNPIEDPKPMGWKAPLTPEWAAGLLNPPGHLVRVARRPGKSVRVVVNIDKWLSEQEAAEAEFRRWFVNVAKKMTGQVNLQEALRHPSVEIREAAGQGPFPGAAFVQAIADGDPWALGRDPVIPAWATALLPELMEKARTAKLLTPTMMRRLAVEERRLLLQRTASLNAAAPTPIADAVARPVLSWQEFMRGHTGKSASEISKLYRAYKADGSNDPRMVAGT